MGAFEVRPKLAQHPLPYHPIEFQSLRSNWMSTFVCYLAIVLGREPACLSVAVRADLHPSQRKWRKNEIDINEEEAERQEL